MLKKSFTLGTLGAIAIGLVWPIALSAAPLSALERAGIDRPSHRQLLDTDLQEAESYNNLGVDLSERGKFIEAIAAFKKAIDEYPAYENAYNNLGIAYASIGDFSEAANAFQQAIALNPGNTEYYNNLGSALGSLGQLSGAENAFRDAISINPTDPDSYFNLGLALLNQGQFNEAIATFTTARSLYAERNNYWGVEQIDRILRTIQNAP